MKGCLLLIEVVDVTGHQKGNFKNLKRENPPCQAPEKFSPLSMGDLICIWSV